MNRSCKYRVLFMAMLIFGAMLPASGNEVPAIGDIRFTNNIEDKILIIRYALSDAEEDNVEVLFRASYDEGGKFLVNTSNATGDLGWPVSTGPAKSIQWYYGDVWDNVEGKTLRLVADDRFEIDVAGILAGVDTNRMRSMLNYIAAPRSFQVDPVHLHNVRDTIADLFDAFGYDVHLKEFNVLGNTSTNVIGRKQGLGNEEGTIIMDAHYDGKIDAPGADDNGSGVVGFLEAARLMAPFSFDRSLEFIGFDQEEEGLRGSIDYVYFGGIEPWKRIDGVLNFEMIGYYSDVPNSQQAPFGFDLLLPDQYAALEADSFRGNFIFIAGIDASAGMVGVFESAAAQYVEGLKVVSGIIPLNGIIAPDLLRSDHAPFWFAGHPALFITDGAEFRNHNYHEPTDVVDSLNFEFMMQVTKASIATMIEMAEMRHASVEDFMVETVISGLSGNAVLDCGLNIYPNPATDLVRVDLSACFGHDPVAEARLYDSMGREVMRTAAVRETWQLDVSGLSCGRYVLEVRGREGVASASLLVH